MGLRPCWVSLEITLREFRAQPMTKELKSTELIPFAICSNFWPFIKGEWFKHNWDTIGIALANIYLSMSIEYMVVKPHKITNSSKQISRLNISFYCTNKLQNVRTEIASHFTLGPQKYRVCLLNFVDTWYFPATDILLGKQIFS